MNIEVVFEDKRWKALAVNKVINKVADEVLAYLKKEDESRLVSFLCSNDEGLRDLNRTYRGIDKPTNVLSFPMQEFDNKEEEFDDNFEENGEFFNEEEYWDEDDEVTAEDLRALFNMDDEEYDRELVNEADDCSSQSCKDEQCRCGCQCNDDCNCGCQSEKGVECHCGCHTDKSEDCCCGCTDEDCDCESCSDKACYCDEECHCDSCDEADDWYNNECYDCSEEFGEALGCVALSYDTLEREAKAQGKTLEDHLSHLVVHSILHLFGYDHMKDDEAEKMENLEKDILKKLGISDPYLCAE